MSEFILARRYANAFASVVADDYTEKAISELSDFRSFFDGHPEIVKLLNSPIVDLKKKKEWVSILTKKSENEKLWNGFFNVMMQNHRFDLVNETLKRVESYLLLKLKKIKVTVVLAKDHSEETHKKILKLLKIIIKKDVLMDIVIEPEIIGGFQAYTDSFQIDGSIKANLEKFNNLIVLK